MNNKLAKLSFVIVAIGLLFAPYGSAAQTGDDLTAQPGLEYFVPAPLEPQLSSDGKTLYNGVLPVVYVARPDPSRQQIRIPAPLALRTPPESAAAFSITYIPDGGTDLWGETCYTFPSEAQAAFSAAASIWANIIKSPVPVTINACWADLGTGGTLGYSGGGDLYRNFSGAPLTNTWYSVSLANSLAGSDLSPSRYDMYITYNKNFTWYYGTDGNTPADQYDLMTVVLHEMAHGLNFAGSMSYSSPSGEGSWGYGTGYPNIYDTFMRDGAGIKLTTTTTYPNPSTALGTAVTSNNIWFHGSNAMAANSGVRVKMYAPSPWNGGSSYSHLDYTTFNDTINELMVYAVSDGESVHDPGPVTKGLLKDLGWRMGGAAVRILHKDGALCSTATGWNVNTPPYYPGSNYAVSLKTKPDGSTTILHKDGAIWNSSSGWTLTTPPYYPGSAYAKDLGFSASETVLINEHFEGAFPPTGWQVKDYTHPTLTYVWRKSSVTGRANYTGGTGYCADADADKYGSGVTNMNTDLWTPPLNLVGLPSATLTFRAAYNDSSGVADYASVDVTTDNGINWTNLLYWTADHSPTGPGELVTLDLTPFCGMNNVIVAFNYYAPGYDWYWEVDDVKVARSVQSTTILHKDGALWNSAAGWNLATPPYYPGSDYARDLEFRSNGSYLILHKYGAVYESGTGWIMTTPPYYPGNDYARALQLKAGETNYVILHKDGALWSTDAGWVLTTPPYYAGSDYARGLELMGSRYIIQHKDGAIYDSLEGWVLTTPPYYPGSNYAVGLEGQ